MLIGSTYIEFDDVEVPAENLIGEKNQGFRIIMSSKSLSDPTKLAAHALLMSLQVSWALASLTHAF